MGWLAALLLLGVLLAACLKIESLQRKIEAEQSEHAACHERVLGMLDDRRSPWRGIEILREEADAWDDPANTEALRRFAAANYSPGGPSVPTMWLRHRALEREDLLNAALARAVRHEEKEDA